jgi:uncharacterized membrane protein YsdA (DUF1294 family)
LKIIYKLFNSGRGICKTLFWNLKEYTTAFVSLVRVICILKNIAKYTVFDIRKKFMIFISILGGAAGAYLKKCEFKLKL